MGQGTRLFLEPWSAEFEGSIQVSEEQEPASVDLRVETSQWSAIRPCAAPPPRRIGFVDGVRRIEHRLLVAEGDRTAFGLLGSLGVGATVVAQEAETGSGRGSGPRAVVEQALVRRVLITGGGLLVAPLPVQVGSDILTFDPLTEGPNEPETPAFGLQNAMREAEAELTVQLAPLVDVVVQDGPLSFVGGGASGRVLGFVKRLQRSYLEGPEQALLPRLAPGERTPLFLVTGRDGRYSWYLRLARGRSIESPFAGVVRVETPAAVGLGEARLLADLAARELPRFASDAAHDPRAPQNLYPVGGLEARLKHLLGDTALVRRAIESRLHSEVTN